MKATKDVVILGIETSCDETSAAVLFNGTDLKSHVISSQVKTHQKYGGVVPEIASREHCLHLGEVVGQALREAGIGFSDLSAIAVTYGPGLVGSLLVGVAGAKAMAYAAGIPLIAVNHLEGHIYANFIERQEIVFPMMALLVSGGHTNLILFRGHLDYEVLGGTRDDAAGEALDKIARALGFGYPGGPLIEKAALQGDPCAYELPRAMLEPGSLDFSFSGMKSAALNILNKAKMKKEPVDVNHLAASFQQAAIDVLVRKSIRALDRYEVRTFALAGGVAANSLLRKSMGSELSARNIPLIFPSPVFCTDNGAMIAMAGYFHFLAGDYANWKLNAVPGLNL
ncbi:O-sialoglycoprotein endopeptidase [Syntrophobotulus glycolicus DSM 8271]|uniref:tRNA N6-adenosine threonylcarbamoyltransferase n=1 Tax=Syntrophobotulus glycolicus (strain DSM 8271 / FlGlyR) TaxID=645991 RepID=F0SXA2_SYNGF|nr:tRNA (adenosine(37)-N6)-threonylcarbamoyltransferase complex transferase subunit TsaD [Syntrophobotulus glycolicus]ADY56962.1 O-sialoglycoprotein endopeptidase [Syntrophobotulus glycolicus DSM 8271]